MGQKSIYRNFNDYSICRLIDKLEARRRRRIAVAFVASGNRPPMGLAQRFDGMIGEEASFLSLKFLHASTYVLVAELPQITVYHIADRLKVHEVLPLITSCLRPSKRINLALAISYLPAFVQSSGSP